MMRAHLFYGYGWVSSSLIFIAAQPEDVGEATADLYLYNAATDNKTYLTFIGLAGESNFDVNPLTKKIIFNDSYGIKIMTIDTAALTWNIENILDETDGFGVFWINSDSIGFEDLNHTSKRLFVKMKAQKTKYYDSFRFNDLENKSKEELRKLRNEIFARHNHSFDNEDMKNYFGYKSWYKEKQSHKVSEIELNETELNLLKKIRLLESAKE